MNKNHTAITKNN